MDPLLQTTAADRNRDDQLLPPTEEDFIDIVESHGTAYCCTSCGKTFAHRLILEEHMQSCMSDGGDPVQAPETSTPTKRGHKRAKTGSESGGKLSVVKAEDLVHSSPVVHIMPTLAKRGRKRVNPTPPKRGCKRVKRGPFSTKDGNQSLRTPVVEDSPTPAEGGRKRAEKVIAKEEMKKKRDAAKERSKLPTAKKSEEREKRKRKTAAVGERARRAASRHKAKTTDTSPKERILKCKTFSEERTLKTEEEDDEKEGKTQAERVATKAIKKCLQQTRITRRRENLKNTSCKPKAEKQTRCTICDKTFARESTLLIHLKRHKRTQKEPTVEVIDGCEFFLCIFCPMKFVRKKELKEHLLTHPEERPHKCDFCPKRFYDSGALNLHTRMHTERKRFVCEHCGRSFYAKSNLKRHLQTHTVKGHKCGICGETFDEPLKLSKHVLIHSASIRPHVCKICGMAFRMRHELLSHADATHSKEMPHECWVCRERFAEESVMMAHVRTHVTKNEGDETVKLPRKRNITTEKRHFCLECGKGFARQWPFSNHLRIHANTRPFKCDQCDKAFKQKSDLKHHLVIHSGVRQFKCEFCPQEFFQKGYLTQHLLIHTGEKPHKCEICGLTFNKTGNLNRHRKRMHGGDRPTMIHWQPLQQSCEAGSLVQQSEAVKADLLLPQPEAKGIDPPLQKFETNE